MLTFYLPLGDGSSWNNNELRYLLRSLEKSVRIEYRVDICTENLPLWVTNVDHIFVKREYPEWLEQKNGGKKHYENYFDTLNKLKAYAFAYPNLNYDFIYLTDDILLIDTLTSISQVKNYPLEKETEKSLHIRRAIARKSKKHHNTILKAYDLLQDKKHFFNFDSHFPRRFNTKKLREMFTEYDYTNMDIPYSFATLYGNLYYDELPTLRQENRYGAGFYGYNIGNVASYLCSSKENIESAVHGKLWVNYNDHGLFFRGKEDKAHLREWIENKFKNKSKHE